MEHLQTDVISYVRDPITGALLNNDNDGLQMYKARRAQRRRNIELGDRVATLESELCEVKDQLSEAVGLLRKLLEQKVS